MTGDTATGYERVKAILDGAAGPVETTAYDGHGRFWDPLANLLEVEIYGVRMIAPAGERPWGDAGELDDAATNEAADRHAETGPLPDAHHDHDGGACTCGQDETSCSCGAGVGHGDGVRPRDPGRGAASGLIKGLKGEFPFDGTQFPPMPWGHHATRVSPSDILFIQDWIDHGCPEDEGEPLPENLLALTTGHVPLAVPSRSSNEVKHESGTVKQRKNVEYLSADELEKLRCTIRQLQLLNKHPRDSRSYNSWARVHGDACQHGWEQFLPWHRMFLYEFEQSLQDIVPDVTLPYWDWTMPRYDQGVGGLIPDAYRCWLDAEAIDRLQASGVPSGIRSVEGQRFTSGYDLFAALPKAVGGEYRGRIVDELRRVNPLWHPKRWPASFFDREGNTGVDAMRKRFHHHYPRADDIQQMLAIGNWRDFGGGTKYNQSFGVLDMNPHNIIHIWSGGQNPENHQETGDMLNNLTAAFDPIFWGHHSNVDRMWALWQETHAGMGPHDPSAILSSLDYRVGDAASIDRLGYEYVKSASVWEPDQRFAFARMRSGASNVHPDVLADHRKVELRLDQIRQPHHSYTLRVFLNHPDADAATSVDDDRYAGHITFFGHGDCIGGPGHCEPQPRRQSFDHRNQHHNEPWNARLDITDAVRRLVREHDADDIEVHLVVVDPVEDQPTHMLEAGTVSLNFLD